MLSDFARDIADPAATTFYLLAANHGQLLEKLKATPHDDAVVRPNKVVEDLLVTGATDDTGISLPLTDLSRSPAAAMAMAIIEEVTAHDGWGDCEGCAHVAGASCPIFENRRRLIGEDPADPFKRRAHRPD